MSKELATIRHDAPVALDVAAADVTAFDRDEVQAKFQELEFRTLMDQIPGLDDEAEPVIQQPSVEGYDLVTDEAKLREWVERSTRAPLLAVDLETSSTDTIDCEIAGYALSDEEGAGCYIPVGHLDDESQLDHELVKSALRPLLENSTVPKLLHNAKFDIKVLRRHGIHLRGLHDDTMVAAFVLNKSHVGLKSLALGELGIQMTPIEDLIGKGRNQLSMVDVTAEEAGKYAAADADITLRLANLLLPELAKNDVLEKLYRELELPLIPILVDMELAGVTLDTQILDDLDQQLNTEIAAVTTQIYEDAGHEFNIGSPKQLSGVLFDQLELPKTRKTSQGYSTDAQQMERLVDAHPIVNRILQWRELTKLRSTYVESLPDEVHESTGRIHTDYNQTVAATGRLSSESPNLQNIPVRTAQGRQIRAAFVAKPWQELASDADVSFVSADYSQIELRVLAHLSEDDHLITAFRNGEDIHAATASGAYGVGIDDVQPEMRRVAKMMNFGVIYGLSAHGLSQRSGMERRDAQAFIDAYFGRFERVAQWIEETKESTKEHGYAETLMGRRRYLPEINSRNFQRRNAAERMAVNMPVQGTARRRDEASHARHRRRAAQRGVALAHAAPGPRRADLRSPRRGSRPAGNAAQPDHARFAQPRRAPANRSQNRPQLGAIWSRSRSTDRKDWPMFRTLGNTWQITKLSWKVLQLDRELIFFPIMGTIGAIIVGVIAAGVFAGTGTFDRLGGGDETEFNVVDLIISLVAYFGALYMVIFCNAALVAAARERLEGGDPNVMSGIRAVRGMWLAILGWTLITGTVGLILQALQGAARDSGNGVMRIVAIILVALLQTAWAYITFFVIPVLVVERIARSPPSAAPATCCANPGASSSPPASPSSSSTCSPCSSSRSPSSSWSSSPPSPQSSSA